MKERIRTLRRILKIKQREMAERLGVSVSNVGGWEAGIAPVPRARIYQICKEYNVRREWLERGEGEIFEPEKEPKSADDVLEEAAEAIFRELSPRGQAAVLRALAGRVAASNGASGSKSITISNSSIKGNVFNE